MNIINIVSEFKIHGVKPTLHRIGIFEVILEMMNHPTAEEIFEKVKQKYPSISMATIYNTLEILSEHSLLQPIKIDNSATRYDYSHCPHFHLIEKETKEIIDYNDEKLMNILKHYFYENKIGDYEISSIKLEITVNKN